mmetsp:Transcript_116736/g.341770  ORF Transcript_116736/g.341770 Transcript_116736/m.341770 type:complete len:202 (-) Transcript_116736:952-1557(-)
MPPWDRNTLQGPRKMLEVGTDSLQAGWNPCTRPHVPDHHLASRERSPNAVTPALRRMERGCVQHNRLAIILHQHWHHRRQPATARRRHTASGLRRAPQPGPPRRAAAHRRGGALRLPRAPRLAGRAPGVLGRARLGEGLCNCSPIPCARAGPSHQEPPWLHPAGNVGDTHCEPRQSCWASCTGRAGFEARSHLPTPTSESF